MVTKLVAVVLYLLVLLLIGVVASRRMKGVKDYFAAGKGLGFLSVAFSARATGESAWLLLGLTGMGAAFGAKAFWVVLGEVLGVAGAWLLMCRPFKRLTDRVPGAANVRLHDLRHWYATTQLDAGESLPAVAARIGDHVETLAKVYAHRGHRSDRAAADELGARLDSGS